MFKTCKFTIVHLQQCKSRNSRFVFTAVITSTANFTEQCHYIVINPYRLQRHNLGYYLIYFAYTLITTGLKFKLF